MNHGQGTAMAAPARRNEPVSRDEAKAMIAERGGRFHGPHVETLVMPETAFWDLVNDLTSLAAKRGAAAAVDQNVEPTPEAKQPGDRGNGQLMTIDRLSEKYVVHHQRDIALHFDAMAERAETRSQTAKLQREKEAARHEARTWREAARIVRSTVLPPRDPDFKWAEPETLVAVPVESAR